MNRGISLLIIFVIYLIAFVVGFISFHLIPLDNFIVKIVLADIIATIVVWIFSVIFKNSSIYDPYWSVAPLVIIPFFVQTLDFRSILLLVVIFVWGIRLTINWVYTFTGIKDYQDWRYTYFKEKFPKIWQLVNLFGIHLFPTIIVVLVMIPGFIYLQTHAPVNIFTIIGAMICFIAVGLEHIADYQRHVFVRNNKGKVLDSGLWKYSRHPNYFGEIIMWWGVFIMLLSISFPNNLIYMIGAIANSLMFLFVSIPLMETRQLARKPEYQTYINSTSMLLLLPSKKPNEVLEKTN